MRWERDEEESKVIRTKEGSSLVGFSKLIKLGRGYRAVEEEVGLLVKRVLAGLEL